jgi:hypothetical protein
LLFIFVVNLSVILWEPFYLITCDLSLNFGDIFW